MAKAEEKDKDKKDAEAKPAAAHDEVASTGKKRKVILFAGIGGVLLACAGVGGFFAYKTFFAKPTQLSAKAEGKDGPDGHDGAPSKADAKADGKADAKTDGKADAKAGDKADAKGKDEKKDEKKDAKSEKDKAGAQGKDEKKSAQDAKSDKDGKDASATRGDADKKEGKDKEKESGEEGSKGFGDTFELPRLDLNLGNPLENRYLRLGISIEFKGGKTQQEELKKREPQLKDIVITSVSNKTRLELLTDKGKDKLRKEVLNRMNEVLERPVANLFFTDFLVE